MKEHLKQIIKTKLTKDDMMLIKTLIKGGFMGLQGPKASMNLVVNLQKQRELMGYKVNDSVIYRLKLYSRLFGTTCFQEVIRKLLFYKVISVDVPSSYIRDLNKEADRRYCILMEFKKKVIELSFKTPDCFQEFCDKFYRNLFKSDSKILSDLKINIAKTPSLKRILQEVSCEYFSVCAEIRDLRSDNIITLFGFEGNSSLCERLRHETAILEMNIGSQSEILYLANLFNKKIFPFAIKRKLNSKEKNLLNYLLYEGDEISYCYSCDMKYSEFKKLYDSLLNSFECANADELTARIITMKSYGIAEV